MRLLAGLLAGQGFDSVLIGDASLMRVRWSAWLRRSRRMGADMRTHDGMPPVAIRGGRHARGRDHRLDVPSAQVKSALLLAGLQAEGRTSVREPASSGTIRSGCSRRSA